MKTIKEQMTKKPDEIITSITMNKQLHAAMKLKLKKEGFSFHKLVEAAVKLYLEEK